MPRKVTIFVLLLIVAACNWSDAKPTRPPKVRKVEGDYNVSLAGFIKGEGQAINNGTKITVTANVQNEAGEKGTFVADNLIVDGNHFSGTGTAMGTQVIVRGRIDAPEFDAEKQLKLTRITATLASSDGKYARLVGSLPGSDKPVTPANPNPPGGGPRPPNGPRPRPPVPPRNDNDDDRANPQRRPAEMRDSYQRF